MLKARVGLCVGFHAGHGAYFQRGKKKKKTKSLQVWGDYFRRNRKWLRKTVTKAATLNGHSSGKRRAKSRAPQE